MDFGSLNWTWATVIGAGLLAVVLLWAMLRNKASDHGGIEHTEEATRELYKEEDKARDRMDDGEV